MAIALVQSKSAFTNAATASITVTPTSATTAGNLLLLVVSRGSGSTDPTFTVPAGWVSLGTVQYSDGWNFTSGQAWYYPNNPGGIASVTVTSSANFGASGAGELYFLEFSGVATASPLDTHNEAVASSFTTTPSISTTTTTDGDLIVGFVVNDVGHAGGTITEPASPWTGLTAATDGQGWIALGVAYQVQTTHGAITYNPTFSAANDWILWIASFKAAGGGGGVSLAASAGLMVLNPPAAATLQDAAALQGQSGTAVLVAQNATLGVAVALSGQSGLAVLAPSGAPTLALAVALVSPSAARAVLIGSSATLALGGQLVAQAGVMVLAPPPSPATLAVAVRLVSPAPAVAVLTPAAAAALRLAVPLLASVPALAVLDATNATLTIIGLAFVALASLSDATVAGAALSDTAISGDTLSDALLASATIGDE